MAADVKQQFVIVTIPGRPVAKARPRVVADGNHVYTPRPTAEAEQMMQWVMREQCNRPLEGPLKLSVYFCFRRPNSWLKARRDEVDDGAEPWYMGRPDLDNLVKLVKDAGNKVLWQDDSQIVSLEATKVYSAENGTSINLFPAEVT